MKKTLCLLLLLLTACTGIARIPTATPTVAPPTATPTIEPSPSPTLTPTPDARTQIFNDLQAEGINVAHIVDDANGGCGLLVNGEHIPNARFDEAAGELQVKYQVKDGDQLIDKVENVPAAEVLDRLSLTEYSVLVLKDGTDKPLAAYGPNITAEKLANRWFGESDVFGTAEAPMIIGDRFQDHFDWVAAETALLEPFPANVYYPDPSKIIRNYTDYGIVNPDPDFQAINPFGLLPKAELDRSPFRVVNFKILEPNEKEGRKDFALIVAEQVHDPSDPKHMQEFNIVDCEGDNAFNSLEEAKKGVHDFDWFNREGVFGLPYPGIMGKDIFEKFVKLKNNLLFLKKYGYVNANGDIDVNHIQDMVNNWLGSGRISPELENLWVLRVNKIINEERVH